MLFRSIFCCVYFFILSPHMLFSANIASGWEKPFLEVIKKLKNNEWQSPRVNKKDFVKLSLTTLKWLKKNKDEWTVFFDKKNYIDYDNFADNNAQISKIFRTKENTFIFQSEKLPNTIIKIDQRGQQELDDNRRSYFNAYEKTQNAQKIHKFSHLYLPIEYGVKSKKTALKYVFSEQVPLFSEAEIDNIALLIVIYNAIENGDKTLEKELKTSFSQMLNYICHVDFDDINYRNLPFVRDGRLAPIDTDSFRSSTGVFSFIENFFAYKLFPTEKSLESIVPKDCFMKLKFNAYVNMYSDEKRLETSYEQYYEARAYLEKIIEFLKTRKARIIPKIVVNNEEIEDYVDIVNDIIAKKIFYSSEKKLTFGWRCEHARDLITKAAEKINTKYPTIPAAEVDDIVRQILTAAKEDKLMISYEDISIQTIENTEGIKGFVCF